MSLTVITKSLCYSTKHDMQLMPEPFNFCADKIVSLLKWFVILDCVVRTKVRLERIKLENTEIPIKDAQSDRDSSNIAIISSQFYHLKQF